MPTVPERTGVPLLLAEGVAIQLEDISVIYRVPRERVSGIKEYTIRWLQRRLVYEEFRALQNIRFQVKRGEVFRVVAVPEPNGAPCGAAALDFGAERLLMAPPKNAGPRQPAFPQTLSDC